MVNIDTNVLIKALGDNAPRAPKFTVLPWSILESFTDTLARTLAEKLGRKPTFVELAREMNRSTRRANGVRGRLWVKSGVQAPRYLRRHYDPDHVTTRRQRRHRARCVRIAAAKGLI